MRGLGTTFNYLGIVLSVTISHKVSRTAVRLRVSQKVPCSKHLHPLILYWRYSEHLPFSAHYNSTQC